MAYIVVDLSNGAFRAPERPSGDHCDAFAEADMNKMEQQLTAIRVSEAAFPVNPTLQLLQEPPQNVCFWNLARAQLSTAMGALSCPTANGPFAECPVRGEHIAIEAIC